MSAVMAAIEVPKNRLARWRNRQSDVAGRPMTGTVAVIGAGPGGLVTARWLLSQGFEPTIFEQGPELGGQWTGVPGRSGVWPAMHTNTSRVLTAFSDLEPRKRSRLPVKP